MIDDKNIIFTCPKCNENFTLHELLQHDTLAFNNYVKSLVQEKTATALTKELATFKIKSDLEMHQKLKVQEDELKHQQTTIITKYNSDLKQLEKDLSEEKSKLKVLESVQQAEIAKKIAETENKVAQKIKELELSIQEKNAFIDSQRRDLTEKINEIKSKDEIEYLTQKSVIEKGHRLAMGKIQDELTEEKNKLKVFESTKQLQIDNKIKETKEQFAQEIIDLKMIVQGKEFEMAQKINDIIHEKENEYRDQKMQMEALHQQEINQLKMALERNKVYASKIKGENFEQEFESELRKGFGYLDRIEKITTGDKKADYLQIVKNNNVEIGKIVYEVKNAKWSDAWLPKFATDVANNKTKYGILVATSFNEKFHGDISFIKSDEYENIWIADPWSFIFVAQVVRKLIEIENNFSEKEKQLTNAESSEVIKEYNEKILKLKDYVDFGLPEFLKTFKIQLRNLEGVETSLHRNAKKLEKTREVLHKKFDKLVKNQLEEIVGQVIVENADADDYIDETIDLSLRTTDENKQDNL